MALPVGVDVCELRCGACPDWLWRVAEPLCEDDVKAVLELVRGSGAACEEW